MASIEQIHACIDRVRDPGVASDIEVVWKSHEDWPAPLSTDQRTPLRSTSPLHISVLDSSFNPPTLAHLALALSSRPLPLHQVASGAQQDASYEVHLLLLSVTNVEKSLKPGDPSFPERVKMMIELAHEMELHTNHPSSGNVAVAVIDEATFVGKSAKLLRYLKVHHTPQLGQRSPLLTFLIGTDTITRFFSPRYYTSAEAMNTSIRRFFLTPATAKDGEEGDGSQIACARRSSNLSDEEEEELLQSPEVRPYVEAGGVRMMDIPSDQAAMSSTLVREGIRNPQDKATSWEKMCARPVTEYIKVHHLYCK
ncbi:hypothetical protein FRB96_004541 [Tulasnella sp. 330]|nr:hypothetical protein FRB96_004541 [Tulasnella sp. 330]